jgi:hypothetical protein
MTWPRSGRRLLGASGDGGEKIRFPPPPLRSLEPAFFHSSLLVWGIQEDRVGRPQERWGILEDCNGNDCSTPDPLEILFPLYERVRCEAARSSSPWLSRRLQA